MACRPRDALQVLGQCVDLLGMLYVARKEDDAANAVVLNEVGDFLGGPGSLESGYEQLTDLLLQAHSNGIAGHNLTFLVITSHIPCPGSWPCASFFCIQSVQRFA